MWNRNVVKSFGQSSTKWPFSLKENYFIFESLPTHLQTLRATFPSIGGLLLLVTHSIATRLRYSSRNENKEW